MNSDEPFLFFVVWRLRFRIFQRVAMKTNGSGKWLRMKGGRWHSDPGRSLSVGQKAWGKKIKLSNLTFVFKVKKCGNVLFKQQDFCYNGKD